MNKFRRTELGKLIGEINIISCQDELNDCISTLENILWDEQDYYDNMPENLQYSQRAENSEESINNMEDALEFLNTALNCDDKYEFMNCIREAVDYIDDATL